MGITTRTTNEQRSIDGFVVNVNARTAIKHEASLIRINDECSLLTFRLCWCNVPCRDVAAFTPTASLSLHTISIHDFDSLHVTIPPMDNSKFLSHECEKIKKSLSI